MVVVETSIAILGRGLGAERKEIGGGESGINYGYGRSVLLVSSPASDPANSFAIDMVEKPSVYYRRLNMWISGCFFIQEDRPR